MKLSILLFLCCFFSFLNNSSAQTKSFITLFYAVADDNTTTSLDGCQADYDDSYCTCVDNFDVLHTAHLNENLSLKRDGVLLYKERRPVVKTFDILYLNISGTSAKKYRFKFKGIEMQGFSCLLRDSYADTETAIPLDNTITSVDFTVTTPASAAADRFRLDFHKGPVYISSATVKSGNWSDPTVWSTGKIPDASTKVTINNPINVDINGIAWSVQQNQTLTVNAGMNLQIVGPQ